MNEAVIALLKGKGMNDAEIAQFLAAIGKDKAKSNTYKVVSVIRLYWAEKPSKDDREAMSKAGYHWNSFEKFWYADYTEEAAKFAAEHGFTEGK